MEQSEKTLDMIVNLCKNRGYVFPGSEIYGGLANSWDYGPLGVEFPLLLGIHDHLFQPGGGDDLGVVVEQKQILTGG